MTHAQFNHVIKDKDPALVAIAKHHLEKYPNQIPTTVILMELLQLWEKVDELRKQVKSPVKE